MWTVQKVLKRYRIYKKYTNYLSKIFAEKQTEQIKLKLYDFVGADIVALEDAKKVYNGFLNIFPTYYNERLPKVEINLKRKSILSPWITKGILKLSRRKQSLYDKISEK